MTKSEISCTFNKTIFSRDADDIYDATLTPPHGQNNPLNKQINLQNRFSVEFLRSRLIVIVFKHFSKDFYNQVLIL